MDLHDAGASPGRSATKAFMHVPKSAGSSVIRALEQALPASSRAPQFLDESTFNGFTAFDALPPEIRGMIAVRDDEVTALGSYELVCGHFALDPLLRATAPSSIATVLREPRSRLLSLYAFWATGDFSFLAPYEAYRHADRPLGEFLAETEVAPVTDNQVCRLVLRGDGRLPSDGFVAAADVDALAAATIERLESLGYVGVQERSSAMWRGLSRIYGVSLVPVRVNVTRTEGGVPRCPPLADALDASAIELLLQRTAVDRIVYRHFLERDLAPAVSSELFADAALARQFMDLGQVLQGARPRS